MGEARPASQPVGATTTETCAREAAAVNIVESIGLRRDGTPGMEEEVSTEWPASVAGVVSSARLRIGTVGLI